MKAPAFQFYADDFLGGVADMTQAEVGAYILLLCHQWGRGEIPLDAERAALITKGPISPHVLAKFPNGKNARLEKVRQEQAEYREKQRIKGLASAEARRNRGSTTVQPSPQPEGNPPSPSPSPKINTIQAASAAVVSVQVPKSIDTPNFRAAWQDWLTYRKERRFTAYKPKSLEGQYKALAEWGEHAAIASIRDSIRNQWQGLFAPKQTAPTPPAYREPKLRIE